MTDSTSGNPRWAFAVTVAIVEVSRSPGALDADLPHARTGAAIEIDGYAIDARSDRGADDEAGRCDGRRTQ